MAFTVEALDHLVVNVKDVEVAASWYERVLGMKRVVAEPRPGRDDDLRLVERLLLVLFDHLLVGGDTRLALGAPRLRALAHPFELALHGTAAGVGGFLLKLEPLVLLLQPGRVVAFPRDAGAAIELEDPAGDIVEEVAVVGHRHDGAGEFGEMALQPRHRFGVEMVGRLVQ
jgi:catechol 2,3-dioxygenase-like lactoylglutathione lyase family enzyme